jgi:cation-transporting ATPase 13A2
MVGDGANDCGALKAAHTGISLSDAESSVASPFTSREPSISCVEKVMREGRAALVTSFGLFKYMAAYSLTQFISVVMLYQHDTSLSDIQFLYTDLFLITAVAFFFGQTKAYPGALAKKPPSASLFSPAPITSLICQFILVVVAQVGALLAIKNFPWYVPYDPAEDPNSIACYENYAVFTVSSFQYVVIGVVFSQGVPYRKPILSNIGLVIMLVLGTIVNIILTLAPPDWLESFFEFKLAPTWDARFLILGIAFAHFICSWSLEIGITKSLSSYKEGTQEYELIEKQLCANSAWPQLSLEYPQTSTPETPDTPTTRMQVLYHTPESSPRHRNTSGEVTLDPAMLISQVQRTPRRDLC